MPFTNRYSSFHGLNDYKSYNYSTTQPQLQRWRPPRYVPPPSMLTTTITETPLVTSTLKSANNTDISLPINQQPKQQQQMQLESFIDSCSFGLPVAVTDELQAEVDYNMNEIENIMICRGKLIEIQSNELSNKNGLIAKCIYISNLLKIANLKEQCLTSDPAFIAQDAKAIIKFNDIRDAEQFINSHNTKYRIELQNTKPSVSFDTTTNNDNNNNNNKSSIGIRQNSNINSSTKISLPIQQQHNIEHKEANDLATAISTFSFEKENINLKINNNQQIDSLLSANNKNNNELSKYNDPLSAHTTLSFSLSDDSKNTITSSTSSSSLTSKNNKNNFIDDIKFEGNISSENDNNNNNPPKKVEGYETLTIRAKLKQRVGPNRTKHVTLNDIDSIMRNVVTVVQNEFMKRFPSATSSLNTTSASLTDVSSNDLNNTTSA